MDWITFLNGLDDIRIEIRQQPKYEVITPGNRILNGLENLLAEVDSTYIKSEIPTAMPKDLDVTVVEVSPVLPKPIRLGRDNKPAGSGGN